VARFFSTVEPKIKVTAPIENPLLPFIRSQGRIVLDGGLATTLEARGHDLNDDLWSAKVLLEDPRAIREVHRDFLRAGADCITTATYQATFAGLSARGLSDEAAEGLMLQSVDLAIEARDAFWADSANRDGRSRPIVAASVGPYGAFLADGSEYTGDYALDANELHDFHERRWRVLADSRADLLACETIPSRLEAEVLLRLLHDTEDRWAWMSFSCRDGAHLSDGTRLEHVAELCAAEPQVAAIGVNCTAPQHISTLIGEIRKARPKPVIVYPNSGERYDAENKRWAPSPPSRGLATLVDEWAELGATGIGGCCRTQPLDIAEMRSRLVPTGTGLGSGSP
jgi:homocysteine S-methyltransferase